MSIQSAELLKRENTEKIISAVQKLLINDNSTDISLMNIAAKAGVSRKTINNIFKTKNNLVICSAIGAYTDLHTELDKLCQSKRFKALSGLDQVLELHIARAKFHNKCPCTIRLNYEIERLKLTDETEIASFQKWFHLVGSVADYYNAPLQKGRADGSIKNNLDHEHAYAVLFFSFSAITQKLQLINANERMRIQTAPYDIMRTILQETRILLEK